MGIRINGSTSGYTELSAGSTPGNNTLTLPENIGSDGQFLKVGATGNLSFDTIPPASSGPESLTVTSLPVVSGQNVSQPSSVSNVPTVVGGIPTYSIASYQWQIQGAGGTNYVDVGTSATLTIPSTINDGGTTRNTEGGKIRVRVTMQDSTPGTALTSGFITSLSLEIFAQNIALTFPTTGTMVNSSTSASGMTVVQVNSGADNDNVVNYSYSANASGVGTLTVVLNDGRVFQPSNNSMNGPCNTNVTSTFSHSGKTVAGVVSDLGSVLLTAYTDGSVKKMSNGTLYDATLASNSPVVNFGAQGTHGTPMFILEDGTWMWCGISGGGATTAAFNGQTYTQFVPVDIMPSGVKAIRCATFMNGNSVSWDTGHGTSGWIILGDDGYLYTADASNTAWSNMTGWTNLGTMAAGGAKRAERNGSVITDKFVDVGPYGGVGLTWGGQGFSACREDGQMWVSAQNGTFANAWARYGTRSNYISAFQDGSHASNYAGTLNTGYAYTSTPGQIAYFVNGAQASAESTLITPSTISGFADPRPYPMMSHISGGGAAPATTCVFIPRS
tara:strand:+ start:182 stop:1855 length:1674 start_codon:yes stop_codon:yes gene_type:complete